MSSYWINSINDFPKYDKIDKDYECDVCIIGGGITGLSCGYYLSKAGLKVIILEKDNLCQKTSGNTTAKITYNHNIIYNYLIKSYGEKFAKAYLDANNNAIQNIKEIIDNEKIDCDFEYQNNYIYTTNQDELTKINAEIKAINELGGNAEFKTVTPLPFKIAGALVTKDQAQFHPVKYILGLANVILNNSSLIFCNSTAVDFKKTPNGYITFSGNHQIHSKYVIVASHYPFKKISRILFYQNVSIYFLCSRNRYTFKSF